MTYQLIFQLNVMETELTIFLSVATLVHTFITGFQEYTTFLTGCSNSQVLSSYMIYTYVNTFLVRFVFELWSCLKTF